MSEQVFTVAGSLTLENGEILHAPQVTYQTWGKPNADQSNVVWVMHALTANSAATDWWKGLIGPGCLFNPDDHYIICANNLGSCYGTTGPLSTNPATGVPFFHDFPEITIRDMVLLHDQLRQFLGIRTIGTLIGGSQGGQQALEWAIQLGSHVHELILIATNAKHAPWGIAFNETQRMAIQTDPSWFTRHPDAGLQGLRTARAIALLSYRSYHTYAYTQSDLQPLALHELPKAASYQQYQGEKLAQRFNAFSYVTLSKAMDRHDITRNRGTLRETLQRIKAQTLVMGITSDILFPTDEQKLLAKHIPDAHYFELDSLYGHDGFLIETGKITRRIEEFRCIRALHQQTA